MQLSVCVGTFSSRKDKHDACPLHMPGAGNASGMLTHWLVQGTPTEEKLLTLFRDKFGLDDSEKPHELLMVRAWHELRGDSGEV